MLLQFERWPYAQVYDCHRVVFVCAERKEESRENVEGPIEEEEEEEQHKNTNPLGYYMYQDTHTPLGTHDFPISR